MRRAGGVVFTRRRHWGSHTSAATWLNTTSTASSMCHGVRFHRVQRRARLRDHVADERMDGSSSSATSTTLYGAWSPYAGDSGG